MTNCIFYSIIFTLFLNFTIGAVTYSEVNRTFMSIYKGVFEASVMTIDENGYEIYPYYNEEILENYLVNYLKPNLEKYVTNYQIKIYYFDHKTDELCLNHFCKDINVTLKAKINYLFNYERSQNFSIYSKDEI